MNSSFFKMGVCGFVLSLANMAMSQQDDLIELLENMQPLPQSQDHHKPTVDEYQQGLAALHRDDHSQAIRWFQQTVTKNPAQAKAWHQMGHCYLQWIQQNELLSIGQPQQNDSDDLNKLALASQALRQAAILKPQHTQTWELLAKSYELANETEKALGAYRVLKILKPDHQAANNHLNKIEAIKNKYAPNQIDDQIKLAQRFYKMGLVQQALKTYTHAAALTPNNQAALSQQAAIYFDHQRYKEALEIYQQIVNQTPDNAKAHHKLGRCYFYRNQFYDAVQSYRKATKLNPDHSKTHYQLAITYLTIGWNDQAIQTHKSLRKLDPHLASDLLDLILEFKSQTNI